MSDVTEKADITLLSINEKIDCLIEQCLVENIFRLKDIFAVCAQLGPMMDECSRQHFIKDETMPQTLKDLFRFYGDCAKDPLLRTEVERCISLALNRSGMATGFLAWYQGNFRTYPTFYLILKRDIEIIQKIVKAKGQLSPSYKTDYGLLVTNLDDWYRIGQGDKALKRQLAQSLLLTPKDNENFNDFIQEISYIIAPCIEQFDNALMLSLLKQIVNVMQRYQNKIESTEHFQFCFSSAKDFQEVFEDPNPFVGSANRIRLPYVQDLLFQTRPKAQGVNSGLVKFEVFLSLDPGRFLVPQRATPLQIAAMAGNNKLVEWLQYQGANTQYFMSGKANKPVKGEVIVPCALELAVQHKHWHVLLQFIQKKAHLTTKLSDGKSLLHHILKGGSTDILAYLVARRTRLNLTQVDGESAYQVAQKQPEMFKFLLALKIPNPQRIVLCYKDKIKTQNTHSSFFAKTKIATPDNVFIALFLGLQSTPELEHFCLIMDLLTRTSEENYLEICANNRYLDEKQELSNSPASSTLYRSNWLQFNQLDKKKLCRDYEGFWEYFAGLRHQQKDLNFVQKNALMEVIWPSSRLSLF